MLLVFCPVVGVLWPQYDSSIKLMLGVYQGCPNAPSHAPPRRVSIFPSGASSEAVSILLSSLLGWTLVETSGQAPFFPGQFCEEAEWSKDQEQVTFRDQVWGLHLSSHQLWPWASYLTLWSLNFLTCKMGIWKFLPHGFMKCYFSHHMSRYEQLKITVICNNKYF